tara:strand:- start:8605 stop:9399 length:795 start_codon:yes stop_codon:yes gene_type:complete
MDYKQYYNKNNILSINADAKTTKGYKKGYLTAILYLSPARLSGKELCAYRTKGCTIACLNVAGRGKFNTIQQARLKKTNFFLTDKKGFMLNLIRRVDNFIKLANKKGLIPVIRLNGTSDIPFENIKLKFTYEELFKFNNVCKYYDENIRYNIFELFPNIQWYDYTKYPLNKRTLAPNYDLTYSLGENNWDNAKHYLDNKTGRVSAVFSHNIPKTYKGYKVINGDNSDLRFLEPKGVIIGLKFKGSVVDRIKGINSGFVIYNNNK